MDIAEYTAGLIRESLFSAAEHPRDRRGRWIDAVKKLERGQMAHFSGGVSVLRPSGTRDGFHVLGSGNMPDSFHTTAEGAVEAVERLAPPPKPAEPKLPTLAERLAAAPPSRPRGLHAMIPRREIKWRKAAEGAYVSQDGSWMVASSYANAKGGDSSPYISGEPLASSTEWGVVKVAPHERAAALAGDHGVGENLDWFDTMREAKAEAQSLHAKAWDSRKMVAVPIQPHGYNVLPGDIVIGNDDKRYEVTKGGVYINSSENREVGISVRPVEGGKARPQPFSKFKAVEKEDTGGTADHIRNAHGVTITPGSTMKQWRKARTGKWSPIRNVKVVGPGEKAGHTAVEGVTRDQSLRGITYDIHPDTLFPPGADPNELRTADHLPAAVADGILEQTLRANGALISRFSDGKAPGFQYSAQLPDGTMLRGSDRHDVLTKAAQRMTGVTADGFPAGRFKPGDRVTNRVSHPGWADGNVASTDPFMVKWDDKAAPIPENPVGVKPVGTVDHIEAQDVLDALKAMPRFGQPGYQPLRFGSATVGRGSSGAYRVDTPSRSFNKITAEEAAQRVRESMPKPAPPPAPGARKAPKGKTAYTHQLPDGTIATRTSAKPYTHVVVAEGHPASDVEWWTKREVEAANGGEWAKRQIAEKGKPRVYSWHSTRALAAKKAETLVDQGGRVEAIQPPVTSDHFPSSRDRTNSKALGIALDYADFMLEHPGQEDRLAPLDERFVFDALKREHGAQMANQLASDKLVERTIANLPHALNLLRADRERVGEPTVVYDIDGTPLNGKVVKKTHASTDVELPDGRVRRFHSSSRSLAGATQVKGKVQEAVLDVLEANGYIDPGQIAARARTQTIKLSQRGRTGTAPGFNPSLHPRGAHGMFAKSNRQNLTPEQIKKFQKQYALPQTGKLDQATRDTMEHPPPKTLQGVEAEDKSKKEKAEAEARKESRAKTNARRKEEGKPPVGSSSSGSSNRSSSSTTAERTKLKREEKIAHDKGEQSKAEALRKKITALQSGSSRSSSSRSSSSRETARERATGESTAEANAGKGNQGESWTGKLNVNEDLKEGVGLTHEGKKTGPSPAVSLLQGKLQALGYDLGEAGVDGRFGPATEAAVRVLQREYGIHPSGIAESKTLQLLETLTARAVMWQKRGIIAAEMLPEESAETVARRVVAVHAL